MVIRRPAPELVAARQWEIKRRYENHIQVGKRTRSMAAIRLAELSRWLDDVHGAGVELEPSVSTEKIARIFVHHFVTLSDGNRRAAQWLDVHASWISLRDREYLISQANRCPLKWSADKLGWHIRLTDEQRVRLKITTIGAMGINKEMRAARRKTKRAELMRKLRERRRQARVTTI